MSGQKLSKKEKASAGTTVTQKAADILLNNLRIEFAAAGRLPNAILIVTRRKRHPPVRERAQMGGFKESIDPFCCHGEKVPGFPRERRTCGPPKMPEKTGLQGTLLQLHSESLFREE